MSKIKTTENKTKKSLFQKIVDGCIILLISISVLSIYESYWLSVHSSKEKMIAIHFDMFSLYYSLVAVLLLFFLPNLIELFSDKRIFYRYTSESQLPTKLVRVLKVIFVTVFIVLCSITFTDKYSRVEFYDDGSIIEYNRHDQIVNEYNENDIEFIELRTNHSMGRSVSYWTEANIYLKDNNFILSTGDYIAPDDYNVDNDIERSLYGLRNVKENFSDKIKINPENIATLLEVEHYYYTKDQAKELCEIFEVDFEEMMIWLEEEWDIVLE